MIFDMAIYWYILLMALLLYMSYWFSGTETAITHLSLQQIAKMKRKGDKNVQYLMKLKKSMDKTIIALLIGNNIVNISLSAIAALIADSLFNTAGVTVAIGIITFLIVLFGEITPKGYAIYNTKIIASKRAKILFYLRACLSPLVSLFLFLSRLFIKAFGGRVKDKAILVTDDSIKDIAMLGEEEGVIKSIERDIIHKVLVFGDKKVKDVMMPMKKVFCLARGISVDDAAYMISKKGYTRIPVKDISGRIVGMLYSKDLLGKHDGIVSDLMRKPFSVMADSDITYVFNLMKKSRIHIAVVADTSQRQIGIVTLEDILEEIVGEIEDEYHWQKKSSQEE